MAPVAPLETTQAKMKTNELARPHAGEGEAPSGGEQIPPPRGLQFFCHSQHFTTAIPIQFALSLPYSIRSFKL